MAWSLTLVLCSILLGVAGELLLKIGVQQVGPFGLSHVGGVIHTASRIITNPAIVIGFACYGLAAAFWIVVLSRLDLSYAYPLLALMYVLVPLAARIFLQEQIPPGRWIGIAIVIIGVAVVARYGSSQ